MKSDTKIVLLGTLCLLLGLIGLITVDQIAGLRRTIADQQQYIDNGCNGRYQGEQR